ncbi:hypothetical protein [Nocardioides sp. Leaf307]|uniref:hypothetical protein n=1 Tax=Nocardioides sp. Leaf307 TaxID=1736331 RepID=UPI000703782D|nr:hypothetical protein [Nocardioides sp. Leaf307]KQQ39541.1 hypothetical protein ASF50_16665 [Nocardioides sp. Leaf307]
MNSSASDPRLRLLGSQTVGGAQGPATQVLRRLDETEVAVAVAADADDAARIAVAAFVTMIARLVPVVVVDDPAGDGRLPNNWWQAASWADLLDKVTPVRPVTDLPPTRQITVGFGMVEPVCDVYVGGGDWNVVLADHPVVMETSTVHGLGLHAAGSLAVSQVLIKVLSDLGFPGVEVTGTVETNLIDHRLRLVDATDLTVTNPSAGFEVARTGFLGVGSVGTSAMALLATACSPVLNGSAATAALAAALEVTAVDKDVFDPDRNPYRYPALLGGETGKKSAGMVERLQRLGLTAEAHDTDVATWNTTKNEPGWHGVVVSSVDTLSGRLDVADVLSKATLSAGVSGTELHVQWERFADGFACPFCDYVRADPPLTQAGVYSQITGIPIPRVLALLQDGAVLTASDVDMAIAAGRVPAQRRDALVSAPLSDLIRQAYAEAEMRPQCGDAGADAANGNGDVIAVASPQVSWFAGTLIAAELVKHMLGFPTADRRVDLDVAGLPAGIVRRPPADATGTCICHSGVRRRWYRTMYGDLSATEVGRVADSSADRAEMSPALLGASPILEG